MGCSAPRRANTARVHGVIGLPAAARTISPAVAHRIGCPVSVRTVTVKPTSKVSFTENYMVGPEQASNNDDMRHLSDTLLNVTATPKVSLAAEFDYGKESTGVSSSVSWKGLAEEQPAAYKDVKTVAATFKATTN